LLGSVLRQKGYEIASRQSSIADQRMELWMLVGRDRLLSTTLPCTLASKVSEGIYHKPIDGNNMITLTRDFYEFIYQISSCGSHSHVTREDTCARGHSFNMGHNLRSIREQDALGLGTPRRMFTTDHEGLLLASSPSRKDTMVFLGFFSPVFRMCIMMSGNGLREATHGEPQVPTG